MMQTKNISFIVHKYLLQYISICLSNELFYAGKTIFFFSIEKKEINL